jgi:cell division septum initiation protein DivIVA
MSTPATVSESTVTTAPPNAFNQVRRGYDRQQVDEHLAGLRAALNAARTAQKHERQRADRVQGELTNARLQLRQQPPPADDRPAQQGFGYRVEKLLRAAEMEAAEVRSSATREAAALLGQARDDAERHRHEVEQSLIIRTTNLEQEATVRKVELDERERQIEEHLSAARDEADRLLLGVRRQAEAIQQDARLHVEQERLVAEKAIRERYVVAEQELTRLRTLRDEVRGELARLLDSLAREFNDEDRQQRDHNAPAPFRPRPQPHPREIASHPASSPEESEPPSPRKAPTS